MALTEVVDRAMLGGLVVGSGSTVLDGSLEGQLQRDAPSSGQWLEAGKRSRAVPVGTGTASLPADQAALTSIIFGVAVRGAGTFTSSMPFANFAST
jgi:ATP synthase delta (OSCP) subunit